MLYTVCRAFSQTHTILYARVPRYFFHGTYRGAKSALSPNTSQKLALHFDLTILGLRSGKHKHLKVVLVVLFVTI